MLEKTIFDIIIMLLFSQRVVDNFIHINGLIDCNYFIIYIIISEKYIYFNS